jgi:hypothetical protein
MIQPIEKMGLPGMDVTNIHFESTGRDQAIFFERPLIPLAGLAPIRKGIPTAIIYAVGNVPKPTDDYFGYHRFRDDKTDVTFIE